MLFFISANISLCNSAILIKTSYVATPVYDFYYIILIYLVLISLLVKLSVLNNKLSWFTLVTKQYYDMNIMAQEGGYVIMFVVRRC